MKGWYVDTTWLHIPGVMYRREDIRAIGVTCGINTTDWKLSVLSKSDCETLLFRGTLRQCMTRYRKLCGGIDYMEAMGK